MTCRAPLEQRIAIDSIRMQLMELLYPVSVFLPQKAYVEAQLAGEGAAVQNNTNASMSTCGR